MSGRIQMLHVLEATLGGTGRHVLDLLSGMAARFGDTVELHLAFATRRADPRFQQGLPGLLDSGIHCVPCDMRRAIHPPSDLACLLQIMRYARDHRVRLIHGHSAKGGYLGRVAGRLLPGVQSVYTPHSSPFRLGRIYHGLEMVAGALLTDRVIAVSPSEKLELINSKAAPSGRIHLIPNGLSERPVVTRPTPNTHPLTVGTIGRLTAQKSPFRFLEIAQAVLRQHPGIRFVWVGDGELRSQCEAWVAAHALEEAVHFAGWRDDIEAALEGFDIFMIVSDYEGSPYALLEAMRAGLPCVVTDVPGCRDVVDPERTGFVVSKEDRPQQVDRVLVLAESAELRQRFGEAGRQRWRTQYTLDRMVESTWNLYRELLSP